MGLGRGTGKIPEIFGYAVGYGFRVNDALEKNFVASGFDALVLVLLEGPMEMYGTRTNAISLAVEDSSL
jgi:hypothetical protein